MNCFLNIVSYFLKERIFLNNARFNIKEIPIFKFWLRLVFYCCLIIYIHNKNNNNNNLLKDIQNEIHSTKNEVDVYTDPHLYFRVVMAWYTLLTNYTEEIGVII